MVRFRVRIMVSVRVVRMYRVSVRVVRMCDEYHHTITHARMMYIIKEKERMYWTFRAKSINACADKLGFARKNFASPVSRSTDDRSQSC